MPPTVTIGGRKVGRGDPALLVAEIAQAHNGSLDTAHAYIDAVADAGVDAVKFQTHIASEESTPGEPWRIPFSRQDESRYDYWKRMEFTEPQWVGLRSHAKQRKLLFLSSPFSAAAVDMLARIGMPAWKLGAGEVTTPDILEQVLQTGRPVLLSTGMSTWAEMDRTVTLLRNRRVPYIVLQCTSAYPCPPEKVGLNVLDEIRRRYSCPAGYSDHSGSIFAALAACTLGSSLLEVHVTFARECHGPDVPASLTLPELRQLTAGVRCIEKVLAHPVDKDRMAGELSALRSTFRKKIVARRTLPAGHTLTREDVVFKKAAGGLPAEAAEALAGRKLKKPCAADEALLEDMLE